MPLGPYKDFDECVAKNQDKNDPEAYCGALERDIAAVEPPKVRRYRRATPTT